MKFSPFEGPLNFPVPDLSLSPLPRPPALARNFYLPALAPNLCFLALANNFITNPGPDFVYTDLVSSICICLTALAHDLCYWYGTLISIYLTISSSSSGKSNSSSSNSFGIDNTNISMPILVN